MRAHLVVLAALAGCAAPEVADLAVCCTCLDRRSPQTSDGDALDASTNCLPDDSEVDGCNEQAAALDPILVVDEQCTVTTCADECRPARLRGATFEVREASLSR